MKRLMTVMPDDTCLTENSPRRRLLVIAVLLFVALIVGILLRMMFAFDGRASNIGQDIESVILRQPVGWGEVGWEAHGQFHVIQHNGESLIVNVLVPSRNQSGAPAMQLQLGRARSGSGLPEMVPPIFLMDLKTSLASNSVKEIPDALLVPLLQAYDQRSSTARNVQFLQVPAPANWPSQ